MIFTGSCKCQENACSFQPCVNGVCEIAAGGAFVCICEGTGYQGALCDADVNECLARDPPCDISLCINSVPGYVCAIPPEEITSTTVTTTPGPSPAPANERIIVIEKFSFLGLGKNDATFVVLIIAQIAGLVAAFGVYTLARKERLETRKQARLLYLRKLRRPPERTTHGNSDSSSDVSSNRSKQPRSKMRPPSENDLAATSSVFDETLKEFIKRWKTSIAYFTLWHKVYSSVSDSYCENVYVALLLHAVRHVTAFHAGF